MAEEAEKAYRAFKEKGDAAAATKHPWSRRRCHCDASPLLYLPRSGRVAPTQPTDLLESQIRTLGGYAEWITVRGVFPIRYASATADPSRLLVEADSAQFEEMGLCEHPESPKRPPRRPGKCASQRPPCPAETVCPANGAREGQPALEVPLQHIEQLIQRMESALAEIRDLLTRQQPPKEWYSTAEVAQFLGKTEYTVREWCRNGRVNARKQGSGRGKHQAWAISHEELQRLQREGLLPARQRD